MIGSVKQDNRWDLEITDKDRKDILDRYVELHPAMRVCYQSYQSYQ